MSLYEKAVLDLLKDGPRQRKWIVGQLCPKIMSSKKAQKTLNELESASKIRAMSKRIEGTRRWTTWYVLPGQEYLLDVDAGRVLEATKRLWSILLRPPMVEEIAVETGITPEGAEKLAYKFAGQTGWFNPRPDLVRDSTEKLGEVLVCAARIRDGKVGEDGKSKDFDYGEDVEIVELAKRFLKENPELLPSLTSSGESVVLPWPAEALKHLGKDYRPKDRNIPFVAVVPYR